MNIVYQADSLSIVSELPKSSIDLIYTDPPFGTGVKQKLQRHIGGQIFEKMSYSDRFDDYLNFLVPYLRAFNEVLKDTGTLYLHLDPRWSHYAKVEADKIFGYENFLSEVIWSYNFGGRGKDRWPPKHDVILVYAKCRGKHVFNWETMERIPYKAPEVQSIGRSPEEAAARVARGQIPTDVWDIPILGTMSKERTGYPSQKPISLIKRIILASSNENDIVLDTFGGSGTTGHAAHLTNRQFILIDQNPQSIEIMTARFRKHNIQFEIK